MTRFVRMLEEIYLRNFDIERSYRVTLRISDDGVAFARRYRLRSGKTERVVGKLPAGVYEIVVELDGRRKVGTKCRIADTPGATALVEVGNGRTDDLPGDEERRWRGVTAP